MAKWYYAKNNERLGPISTTELKALAQTQQVDGDTLVWRDGFESWVEARTIAALFSGEVASASSIVNDSPAQYLPPDSIEPPVVGDPIGKSKSTPSFDQEKLRQTGSKLLASAKAFGSAAGDAAKASLIRAEITKISTITLPRAHTKLGEAIHDKDYVCGHWPELSQRIIEVITKIASLKPDEKEDKKQTSFVEKAKSLATAAKDQGHKAILERQLKKHFSELGKLAFEQEKAVNVPEELLQVIRANLQKLDSLQATLKLQTSAMKEQGGKSYSGLISAAKSYPKLSIVIGCGSVLLFVVVCAGIANSLRQPSELGNVKKDLVAQRGNKTSVETPSPKTAERNDLGYLHDLGDAAFKNLPFSNVEKASDIASLRLTEDFVKNGTFRFRHIDAPISAGWSSQKREEMAILGHTDNQTVWDRDEELKSEISRGEPKSVLVYDGAGTNHIMAFPILRIGAVPGDTWQWTNRDVHGEPMPFRYSYQRCVLHNNVPCVLIVEDSMSGDESEIVFKTVRWYAKGIGQVKEEVFLGAKAGFQPLWTQYRIISE